MGIGLIPIYTSVVVIALCGLMSIVGCAMLISAESRPAGREVLRVSGSALMAGLIFAWLGFIPYGILTNFISDRTAILVLWASGPAGVIFAIAWHSMGLPTRRRTNRCSKQSTDASFNSENGT
ncbi:MAG: hypothetical protein ABGZ53_28740 [Fuerstiella sp.]